MSTAKYYFEIKLPPGYMVLASGECGVVEEDGKLIAVAPFGCRISNATTLQDNFGGSAIFDPQNGGLWPCPR